MTNKQAEGSAGCLLTLSYFSPILYKNLYSGDVVVKRHHFFYTTSTTSYPEHINTKTQSRHRKPLRPVIMTGEVASTVREKE